MIGDRVEETTQTTGTGTWTLDGAATGRRTFVAAIGLTKQCYYAAENGAAWEIGIGTIGNSGADTLTRDTVIASSNAGSKVNFSAGTKIVCALSIELLGPLGARLTYGTTTGSSNAFTLATPVPSRTLVDGMEVTAKMHEGPTGASTLNHVGGAKPMRLGDGTTAIFNGAWAAGAMVRWKYQASGDVWCLQTYLPTLLPAASATAQGVAELATVPEALTGADSLRPVTAEGLGAALKKGTDIASASTAVIPSTGGSFFHVTGTTGITAFSDSSLVTGFEVALYFEGIVTLTHHASNLILPGGANFTTVAGDVLRFRKIGTGQYRCIGFQSGASVRPSGGLVQRTHSTLATRDTTTSEIPFDNTKPQSGEGKAINFNGTGAHNHTPKKTGNKLLVRLTVPLCTVEPQYAAIVALFKDSDADALRTAVMQPQSSSSSSAFGTVTIEYAMDAPSTSQIAFKARFGTGTSGQAVAINGTTAADRFNGTLASTITVEEFEP